MGIKRLCLATGCCRYRLDNSLYCEKHQYLQEERDKKAEERKMNFYRNLPRSNSEFYGTSRYKKERKLFLDQHPYCIRCGATATELHHDWNTKDYLHNEDMFFDQSHWIPLCHDCHTLVSNRKAMNKSTSLNVFTGFEQ